MTHNNSMRAIIRDKKWNWAEQESQEKLVLLECTIYALQDKNMKLQWNKNNLGSRAILAWELDVFHSPWEETFNELSEAVLSIRFIVEMVTMDVIQVELLNHSQPKKKLYSVLKNKDKHLVWPVNHLSSKTFPLIFKMNYCQETAKKSRVLQKKWKI